MINRNIYTKIIRNLNYCQKSCSNYEAKPISKKKYIKYEIFINNKKKNISIPINISKELFMILKIK